MRELGTILLFCILCAGVGCGSSNKHSKAALSQRSRTLAGSPLGEGKERCSAGGGDRETSEYDTSGDNRPDVRKVFLRVGDETATRLVLICREADLNDDGRKDVVRHYDDDGRPLREEADRNFDGQMDEVTYFEDGEIVRQELDMRGKGRVDTKLFFEDGHLQRGERDITGRSALQQWRPDRWEYYESGRLVRMGTDLDGDGKVDRWERDETRPKPPPSEEVKDEEEEPSDRDSGAADAAKT